jgi:acyl-CoA thioesterase-1
VERDPPAATPTSQPDRPKIVFLGDSLTAGWGLSPDESYPAILQARIERASYPHEVVNAGVSGDTSAGGLRRLDWVLQGDVRVLVVALGGNDGLRGLPVSELKRNLSAILSRAGERRVAVLLAGMEAPPNLGPAYTAEFRQAFRDLAREHAVAFLPFLLQDVAGVAERNQPDGIHPNAEGARIIADRVWEHLEHLLAEGVGQ